MIWLLLRGLAREQRHWHDFPERLRAIRFVGNDVYGVWRDEFDVEHVMRLRVIGIGAAD